MSKLIYMSHTETLNVEVDIDLSARLHSKFDLLQVVIESFG